MVIERPILWNAPQSEPNPTPRFHVRVELLGKVLVDKTGNAQIVNVSLACELRDLLIFGRRIDWRLSSALLLKFMCYNQMYGLI